MYTGHALRGARAGIAMIILLVAIGSGCAVDGREPADAGPGNGQPVQVVNRFPHDRGAYTQGLLFHNGFLYEGTGLVNQSRVRKVELTTGNVVQEVVLEGDHFGEGIALVNGRIYQLTWQSEMAFVYDLETLSRVDTLHYEGEGWGLTWDGTSFITSDGTATLRFRDPADFSVTRSINVTDNGSPLTQLNELEYIDGVIWANVYQSDYIARIDPATGNVLGMLDLRGILRPDERSGIDVLNGIAWDSAGQRLFVTGKRWPVLLEIEVNGGN